MFNFKKKLSRNDKILIFNTLGIGIIKGLSFLISLLSVPAYISYFSNQTSVGIWFTILSIMNWVLVFDLGIGNGLRNKLVVSVVEDDNNESQKLVSSAYFSSAIFFGIIGVLGFFVIPYFNWGKIFKIDTNVFSTNTVILTIRIIFIGIVLQLILKLINSILYAYQKTALISMIGLIGNLIVFLYVLLYSGQADINTKMISLAIVNAVTINLILVIVSIWLFATKYKELMPKIKYFSIEYSKKVFFLGGLFFLIQIFYLIITGTSEFLITTLTSVDDVLNFQIYNKFFTIISTLFVIIITPLWSLITKSAEEKNYSWIKSTFNKMLISISILSLAQLAMVALSQIGFNIWLRDNTIKVNYFTAGVFSLFGTLLMFNSVLSTFSNGLGKLKTQVIVFGVGVVFKIGFSVLLVKLFGSWITIIIATLIPLVIYCFFEYFTLRKYINKKLEEV